MRKKLLIAVDTYLPKKDGVIVFLERVIPSLTKYYDITIAAPLFDKDKIRPIDNSKVVGFPISNKLKIVGYNSVKISRKNRKKLKQLVKEADIIWSQDLAFLGAFAIYYGKRYKKPVFNYVHQVTWEHAVDVLHTFPFIKKILSWIVRKFVKYTYNKCTVLMVPYSELALELEEKGVRTHKAIVTLGVDINNFRLTDNKYQAKTKVDIDPKSIVIGYCGRISAEKNLNTLKRAYLRLKEEYKNITLLIVGSGPEEELSLFKNVPDVEVTGFVDDVVPYLQAMDIFVMPSLTETTSLSTLEAMSCGLPVVTTKVGYIKDYIMHKYNGLFFGKHNDYILKKRLALLINDTKTRELLGHNARKTVEQRFVWENTIRDIKKALDMS